MALFQYPKSKHRRQLSPREFKHYQTYKRYLQTEFSRVCVYCRQPDSSAPNLNFGVDHYRPKGIPRFANLLCSYQNLYYCCASCNSRKNNYWPIDETKGPFVVAPCEHEMAAHLRFNGTSGLVEPRTLEGEHTAELLQLNDEATVQWRLGTLRTVRMYASEIEEQGKLLKAASRLLRDGKISKAQFDDEAKVIREELDELHRTMQSYTGDLPLPPLHKQRLGVPLLTP